MVVRPSLSSTRSASHGYLLSPQDQAMDRSSLLVKAVVGEDLAVEQARLRADKGQHKSRNSLNTRAAAARVPQGSAPPGQLNPSVS